ncbi:MAG TPA: beta-ketoacyl-[acyl-carrier-protein] synthase II, partial [Nitrospiraceae bacterium]|nr:beta-ketoacyl-[acyl-carrier-protein] synthase II [Nitrospiraceae bacterium]
IGDAVEVRAIRRLFKSRADKITISATKSLIGHTLGAAGAIGGIASVLALHTGQIHPTANYDDPDPACALAGLSRSAQERRVKVVLLNAFGFGSNNAAVVFKHVKREM